MKSQYIDQLYQDFNTKTETVLRYLSILQQKTKSTTSDVVDFIKLYENLYTSLSQAKQTTSIPTDTEFALEQRNVEYNTDSSINVKDITDSITTNTPLIEYKFEDLFKNLQYLSQAFQNYQDITSKIVEAWDESLNLDS